MIDALTQANPFAAISEADYQTFRRDGFLLIRGALDDPLRTRLEAAVDELYAKTARAGRLKPNGSMHALGGVFHNEIFAELLDHPAVFPHIWGHLGWNIFVNHSHVDVNPPLLDRPKPAWVWHQDGYRQNRDLDMDPRPMLAVKAAFVLSDLSEKGRGGTLVIPGSHLSNTLARTEPGLDGEYPLPPGAVEITADPGDAFIFDRRLWHSRSDNTSTVTRKMIFLGYTYRWIRMRDDMMLGEDGEYWQKMSPLRRQLLGHGDENASFFGITAENAAWDDNIPLRAELKKRGLLDGSRHYLA
jgi:ectoine hydroxylase-related dioxygenase (phytanoyl-CoA dioxygenase family)